MATKKRKNDEETVLVNNVLTTADHAAELEARLKAKQDEHFNQEPKRCPTCGTEATSARCEVDGTEL